MADAAMPAFERAPDLPPPASTVGVVGWMRQNLFSTWYNAVLTVLALWLIWEAVPPFVAWAFVDADWTGSTRDACAREGACWVFIKEWFGQFIYGRYPVDERWRVDLGAAILVVCAATLFFPRFPWKAWVSVFLLFGYPIVAFFLFSGDALGLAWVETPLWGGLFLTLVLAIVGCVFACRSASCWRSVGVPGCRRCGRSASPSSSCGGACPSSRCFSWRRSCSPCSFPRA